MLLNSYPSTMSNPNHPVIQTFLLPLSLITLFSCSLGERDTKLTVEAGNPPKFLMSGSGRLDTLRINGPQKQREGVAEEPYIYWSIRFKETGSAQKVERLGPIAYGAVPPGYIQVYPEAGQSPRPLPEEELCGVRAITMNANGDAVHFAIHRGKVVIDPVTRDGKPVFSD